MSECVHISEKLECIQTQKIQKCAYQVMMKQTHSVRNQSGAATPRYKTKCMNVCIYLRNWNVYKHKRYKNVLI